MLSDFLVDRLVDVLGLLREVLGVLQFAGADVGLLDEEHDVCLALLLDDALEGVVARGGRSAGEGLLYHLGSGDDAVGNLHGRDFDILLAHRALELQVEFGLGHLGHVVKRGLHRVVAAHLVGDGLVVALDLLALEYGSLALGLATFPTQDGGHLDDGFLIEILLRELAVDGGRHLAVHSLQHLGRNGEIIGRQLAHFLAARAERGQHQHPEKGQ